MNEPNASDKNNLDFDEIQLKSDIPVRRAERPPVKRVQVKSKRWPLVLLTLLALAGAGVAGYLYLELEKAKITNRELLQKEETTVSNLKNTAGTLEEARVKILRLEGELKKANQANQKLEKSNADLSAAKKENEGQIANQKSALADVQKKLQVSEQRLKQVNKARDNLQSELDRVEKTYGERVEALETQLADSRAQYQSQTTRFEEETRTLQNQLARVKRDRDRFKQQFEDESSASLRIIQEQADLKEKNANLESEVRGLKARLADADRRIRGLEEVGLGDLVPFSEEVSPGQVNYREPLPDGLKIPRRLSPVVVQVLVSEVGSVEKAFIVPGQALDAELARAVSQSIYKWKFSPPTYRNTRVKTWQPVWITSE